jgi:hypothetical protein
MLALCHHLTQSSIPEALAVDAVFVHLVINDAFCRRKKSGRLGAVSSRRFQGIDDDVLFLAGDRV